MSDVHDVIEAFIDGEYVDPPLLKQALSEEAGRDLLVDLLVLRGLVAGQPATRAAAADAPRSRASCGTGKTTGSANPVRRSFFARSGSSRHWSRSDASPKRAR